MTVFRSSRNLSAQIIDDKSNKTLISATSNKKEINSKKKDLSIYVAEALLKETSSKKINKVYFDRGRYRYHGRIKSFVEALRKGGLSF